MCKNKSTYIFFTYDSYGNYLKSIEDASENKVTYGYNQTKGTLYSVTDNGTTTGSKKTKPYSKVGYSFTKNLGT